MKRIFTFALLIMLSQAYAQSYMSSGSPAGAGAGSATGVIINDDTNVPYRNTTSSKTTSKMENNNRINNSNTKTDSVETNQSSTTTNKSRRVIPITPPNIDESGKNCVDRSGRKYGAGDLGYNSCVNNMKTK